MHSFAQKIRKFVVSEDGPTAVEYAVMLALIIATCLVVIRSVGTNTSTLFQNAANSTASAGS